MRAIALFLLICLSVQVKAECMSFYFDKDGNQHSTPCNTKRQEVKCGYQFAYWNGNKCVKLRKVEQEHKQMDHCLSQGGEWDPITIKGKPICDCFQYRVWDGENCRSDVPFSEQCIFADGLIRVTKKLVASTGRRCEKVQPKHRCRAFQGAWVTETPNVKPYCFCPDQLVWDGKDCRSDIPLSKQCGLENGMVRVTKTLVGSGDCPPVSN